MGLYQDTLDYIFGYVNYEKQVRYPYDAVTFNLSRMEEVLERLGRPQDRFQCVHIAGTKGKGSTSVMVESVLRSAGYRTGIYTSPHLHTFRERIRLGSGLMTKADLVALLDRCKPAIEAVPEITAFEVMTALAFQYFAENGVEWAVLEVGLGGRLDATNVVHPAVCAITSLSYDHVELLGHTLSLIAFEKAGIIKPGVPVVSAPQEPEAMAVIRRVCADTGAQPGGPGRGLALGKGWRGPGGPNADRDRPRRGPDLRRPAHPPPGPPSARQRHHGRCDPGTVAGPGRRHPGTGAAHRVGNRPLAGAF